jgi:hypothetical protein
MKHPFYYSTLDETYPEEYAYKICAWCGGPIVYDDGAGMMFCSDECATAYWKFQVLPLDFEPDPDKPWTFIEESMDTPIDNFTERNKHLKSSIRCVMPNGIKKLAGEWTKGGTEKKMTTKELIEILWGEFDIQNENWRLIGKRHNVFAIMDLKGRVGIELK